MRDIYEDNNAIIVLLPSSIKIYAEYGNNWISKRIYQKKDVSTYILYLDNEIYQYEHGGHCKKLNIHFANAEYYTSRNGQFNGWCKFINTYIYARDGRKYGRCGMLYYMKHNLVF